MTKADSLSTLSTDTLMRTFYVYTLSPSGSRSFVGTVNADNQGEILRALTREFSATDIHWSISTNPPPSPLLAHRVGTDGKLYRH
jgi:hypothetical protein